MEGINLISSTYSDDDDDEIEDQIHLGRTLDAAVAEDELEERELAIDNRTPSQADPSNDDYTPQFVAPRSRPVTPQLVIQQQQQLTIVDYGHDEVTMSPEAEPEEEVVAAGVVMVESQLQITNGNEKTLPSAGQILSPATQATTIQDHLDTSGLQAMDFVMEESESIKVKEPIKDSVDGETDDDLVNKFLPPPPKTKCSDKQQEKINSFLRYKRQGRSYNAEVRNKKEYRNPDFLRHAVTYQNIDEIGSCFSKEVFDPHGYDKSDFYDELEADMKREMEREMERKEQERKKNPKVEFVSGGAQSRIVAPSPKINIPIPAVPTSTAGGFRTVSAAVESTTRDGRNKKSKWDKVDGDQTTTGAHTALLTAANAGAGYTAFAQQRRKETEERKYIEKRIDRRS